MKVLNPFLSIVASLITFIASTHTAFSEPLKAEQYTPMVNTTDHTISNLAAYIPPQCYIDTLDEQNQPHNACFACHTGGKRPNYINDTDLQEAYNFRDYSSTNRWHNLFKDYSSAVSKISDNEIANYIKQSNYFDAEGNIILQQALQDLPAEWDSNRDGKWSGYVPDIYFDFDTLGFDRDPQGNYTGWRAFSYYPFLGDFFPTNGATDDVMIRLPAVFQTNFNGKFDLTVYQINLAITEAMIKEQDIVITPTDETLLGVDLNKDGQLNTAHHIRYDWAPKQKRFMSYVGQAKTLFDQGKLKMAAGLYPVGTEFLHTVRYVDFDAAGNMALSARMKEVRYARKHAWNTYGQLHNAGFSEIKEAESFPNRLRQFQGNAETGLYNGIGWRYQGFIEDQVGDLRPQNYEETMFCMGCHSGVSVTADSSFSFSRKFDHQQFRQGWYHWSQNPAGFKHVPEPQWPDGRFEYTTYLQVNQAGSDFRNNSEVMAKFFDDQGQLQASALQKLRVSIDYLLVPSAQRAAMLNKAYKAIVQEQSFTAGRVPHVKPLTTSFKQMTPETPTHVEPVIKQYH